MRSCVAVGREQDMARTGQVEEAQQCGTRNETVRLVGGAKKIAQRGADYERCRTMLMSVRSEDATTSRMAMKRSHVVVATVAHLLSPEASNVDYPESIIGHPASCGLELYPHPRSQ